MHAQNIRPSALAREVAISRKHLVAVRRGSAEPSRTTIATIVRAVRRITGRHVGVDDLFDFESRPQSRRRAS